MKTYRSKFLKLSDYHKKLEITSTVEDTYLIQKTNGIFACNKNPTTIYINEYGGSLTLSHVGSRRTRSTRTDMQKSMKTFVQKC